MYVYTAEIFLELVLSSTMWLQRWNFQVIRLGDKCRRVLGHLAHFYGFKWNIWKLDIQQLVCRIFFKKKMPRLRAENVALYLSACMSLYLNSPTLLIYKETNKCFSRFNSKIKKKKTQKSIYGWQIRAFTIITHPRDLSQWCCHHNPSQRSKPMMYPS